MQLTPGNIKRSILGLALLSSVAVSVTAAVPAAQAAPALHQARAATPHHDNHPDFYRCSHYHGDFWGYSYGYYHGPEIDSYVHDGFNDGSYWYLGYYPDTWYWSYHGNSPHAYYTSWNDSRTFQYRCFTPWMEWSAH